MAQKKAYATKAIGSHFCGNKWVVFDQNNICVAIDLSQTDAMRKAKELNNNA